MTLSGIVGIAVFLISCSTVPAQNGNIDALATQYQQLWARKQALPAGVFDKDLSGCSQKGRGVSSTFIG